MAYIGTQVALDEAKRTFQGQLQSQTDLYNQQAADQAAKIRQAIASQAQQGEATKTDYTNQMNAAVGTLNTERAKIPAQTTGFNNAASIGGMQNSQRIRNSLSQMGLLQSGESGSQQLLNETTTGNRVNANNLQGQTLDAGYGTQIATAQTDLASKVKAINDAIALARAQGDENSLAILKDAQAKIAGAGAQSAMDYNAWEYRANQDIIANRMAQQQIDAQNAQRAASVSASRASAARSSGPSAAQIKSANTSDAYGDVDRAISQGTSWDTIRSNIVGNASGYEASGVGYENIMRYAEAKYNAGVASSKAYLTSPQGQQQSADALTSSAFRRW